MIQSLASTQLKELVKSIRNCTTAKEERTLVARECAELRNSFKDDSHTARCVAVTKLLYLNILGYPAHFGQMECLKLIASQRYIDKRIGYLGCMMLLDELADVHVLITNCLKNDLNHTEQNIQGLALCTLASICSTDMARMLAFEVEELLKSGSAYIKKKAALCAIRLISKDSELADNYLPYVQKLIHEKKVGLQLCGCALGIYICELGPDNLAKVKKLDIIQCLCRSLRHLLLHGSSRDHTVHGVSNPFLQVKILRMLSWMAKGDSTVASSITELLAQVLTNTENDKNASNAVLYEAASTILNISDNKDLIVLAVGLFGRFIQAKDKNTKYVALAMMIKMVRIDTVSVLRHRESVLTCAEDDDVSIKKRAIQLVFSLINEENINDTVGRLLRGIPKCDSELKQYITSNIITSLEKFPCNDKWQIETFLNLLETASSYMRDDAVSNFVSMISNMPDVHHDVVIKLYQNICKNITKPVLTNVACWCIGEYGYKLFSDTVPTHEFKILDLIQCLKKVLESSMTEVLTKHIAILAIMKLSFRLPHIQKDVDEIVKKYTVHLDPELQQRSIEWQHLYSNYPSLGATLFESMPSITPRTIIASSIPEHKEQEKEDLLDLLGFGETSSTAPSAETGKNFMDLFENDKYTTEVYNKNGLHAYFTFNDPLPDGTTNLTIHMKNHASYQISNVIFQAAVPKMLTVNLGRPSTTTLSPNGFDEMQQLVCIKNPQKVSLKLRTKLQYSFNGSNVEEIAELNNFPMLTYHQ